MKEKIMTNQNFENYSSFEENSKTLISSSNLDNFDDNFLHFLSTFREEEDYYPIDVTSNV